MYCPRCVFLLQELAPLLLLLAAADGPASFKLCSRSSSNIKQQSYRQQKMLMTLAAAAAAAAVAACQERQRRLQMAAVPPPRCQRCRCRLCVQSGSWLLCWELTWHSWSRCCRSSWGKMYSQVGNSSGSSAMPAFNGSHLLMMLASCMRWEMVFVLSTCIKVPSNRLVVEAAAAAAANAINPAAQHCYCFCCSLSCLCFFNLLLANQNCCCQQHFLFTTASPLLLLYLLLLLLLLYLLLCDCFSGRPDLPRISRAGSPGIWTDAAATG
jgi:hypothetical protein